MVNRGQAAPLTRQIKPSKLVGAQRQISVAPFHIGTRALEHLRACVGLLSEVSLGLGTQRTQGTTRLAQGCAKTTSQLPKRLGILNGARLGYTIEIRGRDELRVHREGDGLRQVPPIALLSHIPGDQRKSRLHFGHHPLGFSDPIKTALAALFVLGNGANRVNVRADI